MLYCELCGESAYPVTAELTGKPLCEYHYQVRSRKLSDIFAAAKSNIIGKPSKPASEFIPRLSNVHRFERATKL